MLQRMSLKTNGPDVIGLNMAASTPLAGDNKRLVVPKQRDKANLRKSSPGIASESFRSQFDLMDIERERIQTPKTARRIAERHAELEVEHNWVLKDEIQRKKKEFVKTKDKLTISLPEHDPLDTIHQRLAEIQSMVKPRAEIPDFLSDLTPEQRHKIMTVEVEEVEARKKKRRSGWKVLDFFRNAIKLILFVNKTSTSHVRHYHEEDGMNKSKSKEEETPKKSQQRSSLGFEVLMALTNSPEHRTSKDLKKITWVLRAAKAFRHLFPAELEKELARIVAYESYDDNRHIACQGKQPERFYYVLNGRIQKLKEYQLTSGCVNKSMGYLSKGMTTKPDDLVKNAPREYHLVAKGQVEVLILDKEDFLKLQHTTHGPPVDFLRTVDLFSEFPCEEFLSNPEAIEYQYYGQNTIIAKDALDTPWIHIIKSGQVKVVRIQHVIDVSNDSIFEGQSTEELGCGRSFSHASAMLGVLAKQREGKLRTLREQEEREEETIMEDEEELITKRTSKNKVPATIPRISVQGDTTLPHIVEPKDSMSEERTIPTMEKDSITLPPIVQAARNTPRVGEGFHPHGTFLTREKTEAEPPEIKPRKKEQTYRKAYLQLDTLSTGDIFSLNDLAAMFEAKVSPSLPKSEGLETLEAPNYLLEDAPTVSLMSDGAEVVKISKRFFLQHAKNNTILKVETLQRQFLTTDEVKSILYDKETWIQYKHILMQRLIMALSPRKHKIPPRTISL